MMETRRYEHTVKLPRGRTVKITSTRPDKLPENLKIGHIKSLTVGGKELLVSRGEVSRSRLAKIVREIKDYQEFGQLKIPNPEGEPLTWHVVETPEIHPSVDEVYGDLGGVLVKAIKESGLFKEGGSRERLSEHLTHRTEEGRMLLELVDNMLNETNEDDMRKAAKRFLQERKMSERSMFKLLEEDLRDHLRIQSRKGHSFVKSIERELTR